MAGKLNGRLIDMSFGVNGKQRLTIEIEQDFREAFDDLTGKELDFDISVHHNKRSMNANAYCWVLLDKMADVLHSTKEELYLQKVREVGVYKDFTLSEQEAKTFRVVWENMGTGWPTEQVDFDNSGEKVVIRAYYGSSTYNTKQMSRLIDSIVEDCKGLGIDTMTPEELSRLTGG